METEKTKDIEYGKQQDRLFILQAGLTVIVLAVYFFSGASTRLAAGLRASFGDLWPLSNLIYIAVTVFGYAVFLFPLVYYSDYVIETERGLQTAGFGAWLKSYIRGLFMDLLVACTVFSVVYALLRFFPEWWWALTALGYLFVIFIFDFALPAIFSKFISMGQALPDREFAQDLLEWARDLGLDAQDVLTYGTEDFRAVAPILLAGVGKKRTILIDKAVLREFSREEIVALLAHEVFFTQIGAKKRFMALCLVVAVLGLYLAKHALEFFAAGMDSSGYGSVYSIEGFPVLLATIFVFVLVAMPVLNLFNHRQVMRADALAVKAGKSADDLVAAIEKESDVAVEHSNPAGWMEILLHRMPSAHKRIQNARNAEKEL